MLLILLNDMDEALALVTAGNQVVQDISKAGNGLRTIALRLTGKQMCPNIEQSMDINMYILYNYVMLENSYNG